MAEKGMSRAWKALRWLRRIKRPVGGDAQTWKELQKALRMRLLRNKVTDEEIAAVVSKWTGIPASKMLEGERDKLLCMEEAEHRPVLGQGQALKALATSSRRRERGSPIRTALTLLSVFGTDRGRRDRGL